MIQKVLIDHRVVKEGQEVPDAPLTRGMLEFFNLYEYILAVLVDSGVAEGSGTLCLVSETTPSSQQVSTGSITVSLTSSELVPIVAINGVIITEAEFEQDGLDITINPLNGFADVTDVISIFQNKITNSSGSGGGNNGSGGSSVVNNNTFITNSFNPIGPSQVFTPTTAAVTTGSAILTLNSFQPAVLVTINGQVINSSEYTLVNDELTVTPQNGFADPSDVIGVYQTIPSVVSTGGLKTAYREADADYNVILGDHTVNVTTELTTITLYDATNNIGNEIKVKNSSTGNITVNTTNSQLIDSQATISIAELECYEFKSTGQKWIITNKF